MNSARSSVQTVLGHASSSRLPLMGGTLGATRQRVRGGACSQALGQTRSIYNPFNSIPFFRRKKDTLDPRLAASEPEYYRAPTSPSVPSPSTSSSSSAAANAPTKESAATTSSGDALSTGDIYEQTGAMKALEESGKKKWKEHKYSTARFKISPRKLNQLGRQIANLPIDEAILQMAFSDKRAAERIKSTLVLARNHAMDKGLEGGKLVVAESWVAKGRFTKRIDIKGRGRHGIKMHPEARMHVVLREGKTKMEIMEKKRSDTLRAIRSAGVVREDRPLINSPMSGWRW